MNSAVGNKVNAMIPENECKLFVPGLEKWDITWIVPGMPYFPSLASMLTVRGNGRK